LLRSKEAIQCAALNNMTIQCAALGKIVTIFGSVSHLGWTWLF